MLSSIKDVKKRHEAHLLKMPGVVSVGVGLNRSSQPAIVIGMEGPNAESEGQLPSTLEGYPVEARVVGPLKAQ